MSDDGGGGGGGDDGGGDNNDGGVDNNSGGGAGSDNGHDHHHSDHGCAEPTGHSHDDHHHVTAISHAPDYYDHTSSYTTTQRTPVIQQQQPGFYQQPPQLYSTQPQPLIIQPGSYAPNQFTLQGYSFDPRTNEMAPISVPMARQNLSAVIDIIHWEPMEAAISRPLSIIALFTGCCCCLAIPAIVCAYKRYKSSSQYRTSIILSTIAIFIGVFVGMLVMYWSLYTPLITAEVARNRTLRYYNRTSSSTTPRTMKLLS